MISSEESNIGAEYQLMISIQNIELPPPQDDTAKMRCLFCHIWVLMAADSASKFGRTNKNDRAIKMAQRRQPSTAQYD